MSSAPLPRIDFGAPTIGPSTRRRVLALSVELTAVEFAPLQCNVRRLIRLW